MKARRNRKEGGRERKRSRKGEEQRTGGEAGS